MIPLMSMVAWPQEVSLFFLFEKMFEENFHFVIWKLQLKLQLWKWKLKHIWTQESIKYMQITLPKFFKESSYFSWKLDLSFSQSDIDSYICN